MKQSISKICEEHKAEVAYRTDRTQAEFGEPQLSSSPVVFEVSEKTSGIAHGGVRAVKSGRMLSRPQNSNVSGESPVSPTSTMPNKKTFGFFPHIP